jgi:hypothetical protein
MNVESILRGDDGHGFLWTDFIERRIRKELVKG